MGAALAGAATLSACGGDDGGGGGSTVGSGTGSSDSTGGAGNGAGNGGGGGGGGSGGAGPVTPAAVTYTGVIAFGDTIAITLDAPAAGQLKIRFADSTFGLSGTLVGDYTKSGATYTAGNLAADSADPPPAFITDALAGITATFAVSGTTLTGEIGGLPKALGGGKLSGHVTASSVSTTTSLASLAGLYTFMRTQSTYVTTSGNLQVQYGMVGQTRIDADGTVRMCQFGLYDACSLMTTGTLALADQTRYPGAYDLTMAGKRWGRVFPVQADGVQTLQFDHNQLDSGGNQITGSGVWRAVQTLTAAQVAGTWTCAQPGVAAAQVTGIGLRYTLDGSIQTETLTISGAGAVSSGTSGQTVSLTLNSANNLLGSSPMPAALPGAMSADWSVPAPLPTGLRTQVFMPVDASTMTYFAEVKGQTVTTVEGTPLVLDWTAVVPGTCRKG